MMNKLNKGFLNINETTGLMLLIVKFVVIQLLLIALWQNHINSLNNEIPLDKHSDLQEKMVTIEDVVWSTDRQDFCTIYGGGDKYEVYVGYYGLTIDDPDELVGKIVAIGYILGKNLTRSQSVFEKFDSYDDWYVVDIRDRETVYLDKKILEKQRIEGNKVNKRIFTVLLILVSIIWYIICDFRLSNYTYYTTPLEWMVERIPLLFLWGEKRKAYRKELKEDRLHHDQHIEELAAKERARLAHKKDKKYQKKVQRRKRRKRKMKKK